MITARLALTPFEPAAELVAITAAATDVGGVVSFTGLVRSDAGQGTMLELQHHPLLTQQSLEEIARAASARFEVSAVRVVHRSGRLAPGEPIVFAAAAARHRREAFEAADYLMDRLKTEAVFWKREFGADGSRWIEPRGEDYADARRWSVEGEDRT